MVFPTSPGGPDDYVMIHPRGDGWDIMLAAMDKAEFIGDPRFDSEEERNKNAEEATQIITEWTLQHTKQEAMDILAGTGVLAGATYTPEELLEQPHLIEREMIVSVDDSVRGDYPMIGMPIKLSDDDTVVTRAPRYSEHTVEVLTTILGYTEAEVAKMRDQGVVREAK